MMWLTTPTPDDIAQLAHRLHALPLSYEPDLLERIDSERRLPLHLDGWFLDRHSAQIGRGPDDFAAACHALREWEQFDRGWLVLADEAAPLEEGSVVAYAARVLGTWWGYGCRVLSAIDEPRRFGFTYGTIQGHAECGEELFLIEHRPDDTVTYSLVAMSRPGRWFSWPGMPIARHAQANFRRTSAAALRRAVRARLTATPDDQKTAATPSSQTIGGTDELTQIDERAGSSCCRATALSPVLRRTTPE